MSIIGALTKEELCRVIFYLYKATHINCFRSVDSNRLQKFVQSLVTGNEYVSKYYSDKKKSEHITNEVLESTRDYRDYNNQLNPWLIPIIFPRIGCLNPMIEESFRITLATQISLTKNSKKGQVLPTCKSCNMDCNPYETKTGGLNVIKSQTFFSPNCSLKMTSVNDFTGFTVNIEKSIQAQRYIIKSILTSENTRQIFISLLQRYLTKHVDHISKKIEERDHNIKQCKVRLTLVGKDIFTSGALSEIISRGYYPMFKTNIDNDEDVETDSRIVSNVHEFKDMLRFTCNPLFFEDLADLYSDKTPESDFDYLEPEKESYWNILYCAANQNTLERLINESTEGFEKDFSDTLFKEDDHQTLNDLEFDFYIDPVRLWMC